MTNRHDIVFVERAGKEVAVVVSLEGWETARAGRADKWAQAQAMLADLHERLRAEGAVERLQDFDVVEAIHAGREERDEQLCSWMH